MSRSTWSRGVGLATGLLLLSGCGSSGDDQPMASATATTSVLGGNGTMYVSNWDIEAGTLTLQAHPIQPDGTLAAASTLLSEAAADADFPGIVDGLGPTVVTGTFADYWTTALQVYESGQVRNELAAQGWCGGEGLTYSVCSVLDDQRLARTTELGRDPVTGDGPPEGSVLVSSLSDGSTLAELGPFPDLNMMLGTGSADEVLLVTRPVDTESEQGPPADVLRLDIGEGSTTPVGTSPAGWAPLCPIGADSVLGFSAQDTQTAIVVGPSPIADITWSAEDSVVGCSADGRFLYLQRIPQPPTEESDDTEPANPPTTVERITLSDGSRTDVLTLPAGQYAAPITR
ncbi:MAG: hypothetical protein WCF36_18480 [Candidatus Nanopelagicales bacterium]